MEEKVDNPSSIQKHEISEKNSKKKITIDVDEDDPCLKKKDEIHSKVKEEFKSQRFKYSPGNDPRYVIVGYS